VATVTLALSSHVTMTSCPTRCDGPGAATLFIRPSAVTLRDAAIGEGITAIVEDSAFIGRGYEHVVLIDETLRFTKIFSRTRFGRGSVVGVEIDSNGVYVMKDDA